MTDSAAGPLAGSSGNYRKHTSANPLQRWLIDRFHREVLGAVLASGASSALEVGCGEGFVLRYLRDRVGYIQLEGVDLDPSAVAAARRLVPGLPVQVGDVYRLPYPDGAFDLVLCLEVLEHLEDPRAALGEIRRVTRRLALLSVPHEPWFRLANLLRGKNLRAWGDDPEHRQHWGRAGFADLAAEAFTPRRLSTSFPWLIALVERPTGG